MPVSSSETTTDQNKDSATYGQEELIELANGTYCILQLILYTGSWLIVIPLMRLLLNNQFV